MKELLKRELNKTYLILSSEDENYEESYEIEMILRNSLSTLLSFHVFRIDGILEINYDISAKQNLKSCAERVKLSADTIRSLFSSIGLLFQEMKEYLLDAECILWDLEHIYTKEGQFFFCYCPWKKQELVVSFRSMLEEMLGVLDYYDHEGVALSYHMYQSACKGDFDIEEILKEHMPKEKEPLAVYEEPMFLDTEELYPKEETMQEEKPPGFWRRILNFFLKKEDAEEAFESELVSHKELYDTFFDQGELPVAYTEVLQQDQGGTMLLENMPMGRWRLRPLLPEYEEFVVTGDTFLVGKKRDSVDGYIGRETISRIHSRLFVKNEKLYVADANSTNGTFVNGILLEPGKDVEIFPGDRILFADVGYECYNSL